jgi:hypothetical protein
VEERRIQGDNWPLLLSRRGVITKCFQDIRRRDTRNRKVDVKQLFIIHKGIY